MPRSSDAKVLFFIAGTTPNAAELAAIASTEGNVQVRSALPSNKYSARLESCDFVAGSPPADYISAYPFYNANLDRVAVCNNLGMPNAINTVTSPIQMTVTTHISGPAGYDEPDAFLLNGYIATDQASNGFYDFFAEYSIEIAGEIFTGLEAKTLDPKPLVAKEFGMAQMRCADLYIPPFTVFKSYTRREAADAATCVGTISGATQANPVALTITGHGYLKEQNITIDAASVVGMTQLNGNTYMVGNPTTNALDLYSTTTKAITGVTKANPAVVTSNAHGYSNGDKVYIKMAAGMTELNGNIYTLANVTTNTYELQGVNSTAFTTYTTGGTSQRSINGTGFTAYSSGGVARRNYSMISSHGGRTFRQDGLINTSTLTDTHIRGEFARSYSFGRMVVNSSGVGTSLLVTRRGQKLTGGTNLAAFYGNYGTGQSAQYTGSGAGSGGYGIQTSPELTGSVLGSGGTGHSQTSPVEMFAGGSGTIATGFGNDTTSYGPCLITGKPRKPVDSVVVLTDSYCGFGSADGAASKYGSHGWFNRAFEGLCGIQTIGVSGATSAGFQQVVGPALVAMAAAQYATGYRPNLGYTCLGLNDFGTNNNSDVVAFTQNNVLGNATWLKTNFGVTTCVLQTIPGETTSSDSYATVGNQTAVLVGGNNNNFGPLVGGDLTKGRALQYNAQLPALAAANGHLLMDLGALVRDTTVPWAWRVDMYAPATPEIASTSDGIHPLTATGLAYIVNNMPKVGLTPERYAKPTPAFDATNGLFWFDPTDDNYVVQRKTAVHAIADKFGNRARMCDQHIRTKRPLSTGVIGAKRALLHDGTDDYLQVKNDFDYTAAAGFTLFAVVNFASLTGTQAILSHNVTSSTTARGWTLQKVNSTNILQFVQSTDGTNTGGTGEQTVASSLALAANTAYVVAVRFKGAGLTELFCNSATPLALATPGTFTSLFFCPGDIVLGGQLSAAGVVSLGLNGRMGDVMMFNGAISDARMTEVMTFLKSKYGI